MKVGDLVKLKAHCRESDKLAIVVESPDPSWRMNCVKIMFLHNGLRTPATKNNLEVISESR